MAIFKQLSITLQFLDNTPNSYVVFGDNLQKFDKSEDTKLRSHPHAIGFITKKFPDNNDGSFYRPEEYIPVFEEELYKLEQIVKKHQTKTFYVTKIGSGLANRYHIWEKVIKDELISTLFKYHNVVFCWNEHD